MVLQYVFITSTTSLANICLPSGSSGTMLYQHWRSSVSHTCSGDGVIPNLSALESSQKISSFMITDLSLWGFLQQWWLCIPPLAAGWTLDDHAPRLNSTPWLLNPHRTMLDPHFCRSCSLTAHSFVWTAVKPTSHLCYLPRESVRTHATLLRSMAVFCYSIKPWQAQVPSFNLLLCQTWHFISNQYKSCFLKE